MPWPMLIWIMLRKLRSIIVPFSAFSGLVGKRQAWERLQAWLYQQTGLLSHTDKEGLQLLDHILSTGIGPVILPSGCEFEIMEAATPDDA